MTPAQAVSAKLEKANEGTSHRMSLEPEGCVKVAASDQIGLFRVVPIPRERFGSQTGSTLAVNFPTPCHTQQIPRQRRTDPRSRWTASSRLDARNEGTPSSQVKVCVARNTVLPAQCYSSSEGPTKIVCDLSFRGLAGKPLPSCSPLGCHIGAQRDCEMKCGATFCAVFSPDSSRHRTRR